MIRCSYHSEFRGKMMSDVADALSINVDNLSEKEKFQFLMSVTEYDCIIPVFVILILFLINVKLFFLSLHFFNHLYLELVGGEKHRKNK